MHSKLKKAKLATPTEQESSAAPLDQADDTVDDNSEQDEGYESLATRHAQ